MKPLFTIHEGEFLVGDYITRMKPHKWEVWVPTKDDGIDLLVTNRKRLTAPPIRIQVKHSRGFDARHALDEEHAGCAKGWYTLNPAKIRSSRADLWVFTILTLQHDKHFIVVPTNILKRRLPRASGKTVHFYLSVWSGFHLCFNTRGMNRSALWNALENGTIDAKRDYSSFLENWDLLDSAEK